MDLGYCVIFSHGEQGMPMFDVIVTGGVLEKAISTVEFISGCSRGHERYPLKVFDLTKIYHMYELGMDEAKDLIEEISRFSPESVDAISFARPVEFTVQAYQPFGARTWINRRWGVVTNFLRDYLNKTGRDTKEYMTKQRELRKTRRPPTISGNKEEDQ